MADERISVELTADASQLVKEFSRASREAKEFSKATLPLTQAEMTRTFVASQKLRRGLKDQEVASRGAGNGMLQLAQFADDAQYGLRGVMNNIPGLVMGLGGGAGLAGALSLVVLAGAKVGPMLRDSFGVENQAEIDKIREKLEGLRRASIELATGQGRGGAAGFLQELNAGEGAVAPGDTRAAEAAVRRAQARTNAVREQIAREEREAAELQRRVTGAGLAEGSLPSARERLKELEKGLPAGLELSGSVQERAKQVAAALEEQRALVNRLEEESRGAGEGERRRLASLEGSLAGLRAGLEKQIALEREAIATSKEAGRVKEESAKKSAAETRAVNESRAAVVAKASAEADAALARRQQQGYAERAADEEEKRLKRQAAAELQAERRLKGREFLQDMEVLKLRAGGRTAEAEALGREVRLRRESVSLAKELGITEEKALELLRRRQGLEDQISRGPRGDGSRIRRSSGIQVGETGLRSRLEGPRGLGESRGLSRSAEALVRGKEAGPDRGIESAARNYYERSLQNEEAMVKALQNIGVY